MKLDRFAIYAWLVLAGNLLVVAWGAYVRATGSGAGCGSHWPLCNGEVVPRSPRAATVVEFTHRASSGVALLLVVALLVWALRAYARGHRVRRGAVAVTVLILVEALLGAGLVLFRLVEDNASLVRAVSMVAHLVNTFLLIAAVTLTAWWASGGAPLRLRGQGTAGLVLAAGLAGMLLLGASGAVAALGDTLFPARSLAEGLRADFSSTAHFLLRLRLLHPVIAIAEAVYLLAAVPLVLRARPAARTRVAGRALTVLVVAQLAAGTLNVALLAPVWMQLVHLLLADLVWIALVLFAASALAAEPAPRPATGRPGRLAPSPV